MTEYHYDMSPEARLKMSLALSLEDKQPTTETVRAALDAMAPLERGQFYRRTLDQGLFVSARKMAEELGEDTRQFHSFWKLAAMALVLATGQASAQSYGQSDAPAAQARAPLPVKTGKVLDVQPVRIEVPAKDNSTALGGIIGAAAGAFLAKDGTWQSQALAGTIGAAVGSKAAQSASKEMRDAVQVIVKLEDGQALAIIQEPEGEALKPGQSVYLVGQYPAVRVIAAR